MPKGESKPKDKERFSFCPQCSRKGMYHIKQQYCRCRYCGTYIVSPEVKSKLVDPEGEELPVTG